MANKLIDMTGWNMADHGVLNSKVTVIKRVEDHIKPSGRKQIQYLCQCSCGNQFTTLGESLRSGNTLSCGCYATKRKQEAKAKFNQYDLLGEYGKGWDCNKNEFWFDLEDYNLIKDYCWSKQTNGYFHAYSKNQKNKWVLLHRVIMNIVDDLSFDVDHIYHNLYDNRKSQLRLCTRQENECNKGLTKANTSGVTGVCWNKLRNKWYSGIRIFGKNIHLGCYDNFDDAVKARKEAEIKYYGDYRYKDKADDE